MFVVEVYKFWCINQLMYYVAVVSHSTLLSVYVCALILFKPLCPVCVCVNQQLQNNLLCAHQHAKESKRYKESFNTIRNTNLEHCGKKKRSKPLYICLDPNSKSPAPWNDAPERAARWQSRPAPPRPRGQIESRVVMTVGFLCHKNHPKHLQAHQKD